MVPLSPLDASDVSADIALLTLFVHRGQLQVMVESTRGEEGAFFLQQIRNLASRIRAMPSSYETDGQGEDAVAHLRYFVRDYEFLITEKDRGDDSGAAAQHQAFGLASLGFEPELGYISIAEIISLGAELDLYFTPKPIEECRAIMRRSAESYGM